MCHVIFNSNFNNKRIVSSKSKHFKYFLGFPYSKAHNYEYLEIYPTPLQMLYIRNSNGLRKSKFKVILIYICYKTTGNLIYIIRKTLVKIQLQKYVARKCIPRQKMHLGVRRLSLLLIFLTISYNGETASSEEGKLSNLVDNSLIPFTLYI